ncbi:MULTISPECIES: hypothetical protein [unclassified Streptomyces]|uniref:hypothetical protein n=1 Tax=unclassified Streptomyces TaxID=2593676 RepID=UPI0033A27370
MAPGAPRSVFDSCTARSGPSTAYIGTGAPATASDGSGSTSTSRAVALNSATVDALETLTATAATRRPTPGEAPVEMIRKVPVPT